MLVLFDLTLVQFPHPGAPPNLVPFATIRHDLCAGGGELLVNGLGNLVAFMPLGFLLRALRGPWMTAGRVGLVGLMLSLLIESLQYRSGRRVADVDDLTLNTLGTLLGYGAYVGLARLRARLSLPCRAAV
jgi:glycopeptide antibiotics resistance protein